MRVKTALAGFVGVLIAASAAVAAVAASVAIAAAPPDWPAYHGNAAHSGLATGVAHPTSLKVTKSTHLDGAVYASPLVLSRTVVVATENNSVYGFSTSAKLLWKRHLGAPSPASERPCGNIDPLGITGTPVYSAAKDRIYLVAELGRPVRHVLYALNPHNGKVVWKKGIDLPGVNKTAMQQRAGLVIAAGRVWVAFGGLAGDCGQYKGRLVGVKLTGPHSRISYTVPTPREGGIWHPPGPVVDRSGNLLVAVGNGEHGPGDSFDHSDTVLRVSATSAKLLDYFAPSQWASDNAGDVDLGSIAPALVGTKWIVQGGKSDRVYVLRQSKLGHIGGEVSVANICASYGGAAVKGSIVYLPCTDGVRAVRVSTAGRLSVLWHASSTITGSPVIGGKRVWTLDQNGGVLHALSPATGRSLEEVQVGQTSRFATPALYGHLVVVPTLAGVTFVHIS